MERSHLKDPMLSLILTKGKINLKILLKKSHISEDSIPKISQKNATSFVLFAPYIGGPLGEVLRTKQINYMDLSGNCYLNISDKFITHIEGRRKKERIIEKGVRAPGYQVLFALLVDSSLLKAPIRAISAAAGVSRQSVVDMQKRLVERGILVRAKNGFMWAEGRKKEALEDWLIGYRNSVRPKLIKGRFRGRENDPLLSEGEIESILKEGEGRWGWGGIAGAYRLMKHYRGDVTHLYIENYSQDIPNQLKVVPSENGPLLLLSPPGPIAFNSELVGIVNTLLIYSELLTLGDERARETAQLLYDRFLKDKV